MYRRGLAPSTHWCAVAARWLVRAGLAALILLALAWPALAQNAAEAKPASKPQPPAKEEKQKPAKQGPQPKQEPAKPSPQPPAKAEPEQSKQEEPQKQPPAEPNAAPEKSKDAAGAAPAAGPDQAAPATGEPAAEAGQNAAEASAAGDGASATGEPPAPEPGPDGAAANAAEQAAAGDAEGPPAIAVPSGNEAEGRAAGTGSANRAEGARLNQDGIAEPPGAPFEMATPAELAGSVTDYTEPSIDLTIPPLDEMPARPDPDSFYQPNRDYLQNRPLPPLNQNETDEERIARNIEESLKLIDLSKEQRPAEGVQIPLPSGVVTFKASDAFQYDRPNRILKFTGNAEILFQDIAIWADYIEVNDSAASAYAKGYVAVQNQDEILYCDEAYLNYDTQTLELFWVEGNTGGPRIQGALYFEADHAWGTFDNLVMEKVKITTCDPFCGSNREYQILSRKAVYKRNRSILLNDVFIQVKGTKIGYTPLLAFPLMRDRQIVQDESEVQQNYGYTREEGWFAKFAYTYSVRYAENVNRLLGVAKVDLTQKKGPGLGLRQDFYIPGMGVTTLRGYYQREWDWEVPTHTDGTKAAPEVNLAAELIQELNLSREVTGSLTIKRNDQYIPSVSGMTSDRRNNSWDSRFNLAYKGEKTDVSIGGTHRETISGGTRKTDGTQEPEQITSNLSGNFQVNQKISNETTFTLSEDYSANKGGTSGQSLPADQEGNFEMHLNWQGGANTDLNGWNVKTNYAERGIDYDRDNNTRDNNTQIRKELPTVEINAPRDLINDNAYINQFKLNFDNLVTGRRRDPDSSFRAMATVGGGDRFEFSRSSSLDTRFTFKQYAYDDGNSQYVMMPNASYVFDPHTWWKFDAGWNMTYRQGVKQPPVSGDRTAYYQSGNYGLTMTNHRSWNWQLRTGYNLAEGEHNAITSTFNWDPNKTFGLTHTLSYNPAISKNSAGSPWGVMRVNGAWRSDYIDPNGYYNWLFAFTVENNTGEQFELNTFNTTWYKRFKRGWSTEIAGGYRFGQDVVPDASWNFLSDYIKSVRVRKVNCCTTIEATWRTELNEVMVNVYLNALPQYPGTYWTKKPFDDDYEQQFLYPIDQTRNDILTDVFGISQTQALNSLF
jgi:hypothetical protein